MSQQDFIEIEVRPWIKCQGCALSGPLPDNAYHLNSGHSYHISNAAGISQAMAAEAKAKREGKKILYVLYDKQGKRVGPMKDCSCNSEFGCKKCDFIGLVLAEKPVKLISDLSDEKIRKQIDKLKHEIEMGYKSDPEKLKEYIAEANKRGLELDGSNYPLFDEKPVSQAFYNGDES